MNSMLVIAEHTNLLWLYNAFLVYLRLRGETLRGTKLRSEPKIDTPNMLPAEERLTTRDLFSGVEILNSAGGSSLVKSKGPSSRETLKTGASFPTIEKFHTESVGTPRHVVPISGKLADRQLTTAPFRKPCSIESSLRESETHALLKRT